jgi:ABC-type transporter Mla maintaining outer membrane lipid asymmetry permease subunit MlaE
MNKEPALIIGTVVTIILGALQTLQGNGFISDVAAGTATDLVNQVGNLLVLLVPLITAAIVRGRVYSPATYDAK